MKKLQREVMPASWSEGRKFRFAVGLALGLGVGCYFAAMDQRSRSDDEITHAVGREFDSSALERCVVGSNWMTCSYLVPSGST